MFWGVEKILLGFTVVLLLSGAALATFSALEYCARERENPGMLVVSQGLYRKLPNGNALFSSLKFSPENRRALLMLAREPASEAELTASEQRLRRFEKMLPLGDALFLIDDCGNVLLERPLTQMRKVFRLTDEMNVLQARLKSVPVNYFPADALRGKVRLDLWEGNAEFPVPEAFGGER